MCDRNVKSECVLIKLCALDGGTEDVPLKVGDELVVGLTADLDDLGQQLVAVV